MLIALTTSHGRIAPCFAGVELCICADAREPSSTTTLATTGWHPLSWGRELVDRGVEVLICAGIDMSTWAALRGHGVDVIPEATGDVEDVLADWAAGRLVPPAAWPPYHGMCPGRRCRRRGRNRRRGP